MSQTKIEWAEAVWNPVTDCTKISPGCQNCYAERMAKRLTGRCGYPADNPFKVTLHPERLKEPFHWRKPRRVFVCSMADLFHDDVPFEFLARVFGHMHHFNKNTFLVLTKRPERMRKFISWFRENWLGRFEGAWPREYQHVWLGVTAENQEQADKRIPILLQIPAAVRFVSVEPMLSEVNLSRYLKWPLCKHWRPDEGGDPKIYGKYHWQKQGLVSPDWIGLDWVICGGESGPGARPMHPDWARSLRDQCQAAGTPFFFKQWGEWACEDFEPYYGYGSDSGKWDEYICRNGEQGSCKISDGDGNWLNWTGNPDDTSCIIRRVGKKKAGRLLDGRTWNEMPENQKW